MGMTGSEMIMNLLIKATKEECIKKEKELKEKKGEVEKDEDWNLTWQIH